MKWLYGHIADFSAAQYEAAYRQLSACRKEHIDRFRQEEDRTRSLAGELLAKKLLACEFSLPDAVLLRKPSGCPAIDGSDLHISIAHCDGWVVCAADTAPVGIDIERIRPIRFRAAEHVCTPGEMDYLLSGSPAPDILTEESMLLRFFEIWTAKEAFFKKAGTGITDLKSVDILPLRRSMFRKEDYLIQIICET